MPSANVLFLCTGNSARSQMAEGLLRQEAGDRFAVHSAGLEPKGVHPLAVRAMDEIGVDLRGQASKDCAVYLGHLFAHYLIILCDDAARRCPTAWPGMVHRLEWMLPDPAAVEGDEATRLQAFRDVRDALHERIRAWLETEPWRGLRGVGSPAAGGAG